MNNRKNKIISHVYGEIALDVKQFVVGEKHSCRWDIEEEVVLAGGMGANIAVLLNMFSVSTVFHSILDDRFLDIIGEIESAGVVFYPLIKGELSKIYDIFFNNDERRVVSVKKGDLLKEFKLRVSENKYSDILIVTPIHFKSAGAIPALYSSKTLKVLVPAMEYNDLSRIDFIKLVKNYNILVLDKAEAKLYCNCDGMDLDSFYLQFSDVCIVITDGAKEVVAIFNGEIWRQSTVRVPGLDIIDVMGCGDAFAAAFSYYFLSTNGDVRKSLIGANKYAAVIASIGGMFESFIKENIKIKSYIKDIDLNFETTR